MRTWVYRVAHNVATSQVISGAPAPRRLVGLDELDETPAAIDTDEALRRASRAGTPAGIGAQLSRWTDTDAPLSRRVDAASIGDVTGCRPQRRDQDSPHQGGLARRFHDTRRDER